MTADLFPSYILAPKKIIESIAWFLNPIEEPPQKFLQLMNETRPNIYSNLLENQGFIISNVTWAELISNKKNEPNYDKKFPQSYYNLVFSLANDNLLDNFENEIHKINELLRPSSYFIYEMKIDKIDKVKELFLKVFESVSFLIPWSELNTNPFSPFNKDKSDYCWVVALTNSSDEDPAAWIEDL